MEHVGQVPNRCECDLVVGFKVRPHFLFQLRHRVWVGQEEVSGAAEQCSRSLRARDDEEASVGPDTGEVKILGEKG